MAVLVHHQHSEPIARVQQRLAGRIVRRSPGVAAEFLELLHAPCLQAVGNSDSNAGEIDVAGRPTNLDALAVEIKSLVRVEADRANAECRRRSIDRLIVLQNRSAKLIKMWRLNGPELRTIDRDALNHFALP